MFFSIALLSQSIVTILNRAFYADNDTKTPLYIGISTIVLNMIFSSIFMKTTNLGVSGMALSYSLVSAINAVLLLSMLNRRMKGIYLDKLLIFIVKVIPASLAMGVVLFLLDRVIPSESSSKLMQFINLMFEITVGVVVYFAAALLLRVEEAQSYKNMFLGKLKKIIGIRKI